MERSEIPGQPIPHYASLHANYKIFLTRPVDPL